MVHAGVAAHKRTRIVRGYHSHAPHGATGLMGAAGGDDDAAALGRRCHRAVGLLGALLAPLPVPTRAGALSHTPLRAVNGSTVRSFSTHRHLSAAQGSSTTVSRFGPEVALNWLLIGSFPIHSSPASPRTQAEEAARVDTGGARGDSFFFAALLSCVTRVMAVHPAVQPVQQCGAMAALALVSLHGLPTAEVSHVRARRRPAPTGHGRSQLYWCTAMGKVANRNANHT
jgi:hypothetical protein